MQILISLILNLGNLWQTSGTIWWKIARSISVKFFRTIIVTLTTNVGKTALIYSIVTIYLLQELVIFGEKKEGEKLLLIDMHRGRISV